MMNESQLIVEILNAEQAWPAAHVCDDMQILASLMHKDYVIIRPDGTVVDKE